MPTQSFIFVHKSGRLFFVIVIALLGVFGSVRIHAQSVADSARKGVPVADTSIHNTVPVDGKTTATVLPKKHEKFQPNAKRAGLYSAILPGMGQLYNRQYWKVPVIYAGLAVAGYFIADNFTNYQSYRKAYISRINNPYYVDKYTNVYTAEQLQQLQNDYNKFLDMSILFTGIGYTLQILEAMTGAHLKNFDISRDISMHITPVARPEALGLGLVVNFK